ncbi:MAG: ATP-binding protein [Prevotella sp.]
MGSEIHIDMYDDRLEIYSPGGMMDGRLIQQLNPLTVPSKRRNPLLADFFSRLGLMERRGSGMKKIINTYRRYEHLSDYHTPEFTSNASEFHVTLWNLNYNGSDNNTTTDRASQEMEFIKEPVEFTKEFIKEPIEFTKEFTKEFIKEPIEFTKEFIKASRQIYKLISMNPKVSTAQMADSMGLSTRQVLKYLKRLQDLGKIARVGGRKMGEWKIIDEEYEGFFDRI